jgi:hypothetical protein
LRATLVAADPEKQVRGALVSRGKGIVFKFLRLHPSNINCPNQLGLLARRNRGTIDYQVDAITIVAVSPASSGDPYVYFNSYARTQVTSECGLIGLTSLNLATWKFPQTGEYTRRASLCNEIASVPLDQAGYNAKARHESIHESLEG